MSITTHQDKIREFLGGTLVGFDARRACHVLDKNDRSLISVTWTITYVLHTVEQQKHFMRGRWVKEQELSKASYEARSRYICRQCYIGFFAALHCTFALGNFHLNFGATPGETPAAWVLLSFSGRSGGEKRYCSESELCVVTWPRFFVGRMHMCGLSWMWYQVVSSKQTFFLFVNVHESKKGSICLGLLNSLARGSTRITFEHCFLCFCTSTRE
jgi:hypothetical protein